MFLAALTSRSWTVSQSPQVHTLIPRPATPVWRQESTDILGLNAEVFGRYGIKWIRIHGNSGSIDKDRNRESSNPMICPRNHTTKAIRVVRPWIPLKPII